MNLNPRIGWWDLRRTLALMWPAIGIAWAVYGFIDGTLWILLGAVFFTGIGTGWLHTLLTRSKVLRGQDAQIKRLWKVCAGLSSDHGLADLASDRIFSLIKAGKVTVLAVIDHDDGVSLGRLHPIAMFGFPTRAPLHQHIVPLTGEEQPLSNSDVTELFAFNDVTGAMNLDSTGIDELTTQAERAISGGIIVGQNPE